MTEEMKNKVSILVSSCDKYEDAWMPFFTLLDKQWPGCPFPRYLSTDTKECRIPGVITICSGDPKMSWTARLRKCLNEIKTEYVLWFLEDYFLYAPVETEGFEKAFEIMEENKEIGLVHYPSVDSEQEPAEKDLSKAYYELPVKKRTFRTRVAVSLFRKEYFLKLLYGDESPWQYERESHIRSMVLPYKIYRQDYSLYPPVFHYCLDHTVGIGITAGKWLPNTEELFLKNGITGVDVKRLGVLTPEVRQEIEKKRVSIKESGLKLALWKRFVHPVKHKVRHWWWLQERLIKKKKEYYRQYYRELADNKSTER